MQGETLGASQNHITPSLEALSDELQWYEDVRITVIEKDTCLGDSNQGMEQHNPSSQWDHLPPSNIGTEQQILSKKRIGFVEPNSLNQTKSMLRLRRVVLDQNCIASYEKGLVIRSKFQQPPHLEAAIDFSNLHSGLGVNCNSSKQFGDLNNHNTQTGQPSASTWVNNHPSKNDNAFGVINPLSQPPATLNSQLPDLEHNQSFQNNSRLEPRNGVSAQNLQNHQRPISTALTVQNFQQNLKQQLSYNRDESKIINDFSDYQRAGRQAADQLYEDATPHFDNKLHHDEEEQKSMFNKNAPQILIHNTDIYSQDGSHNFPEPIPTKVQVNTQKEYKYSEILWKDIALWEVSFYPNQTDQLHAARLGRAPSHKVNIQNTQQHQLQNDVRQRLKVVGATFNNKHQPNNKSHIQQGMVFHRIRLQPFSFDIQETFQVKGAPGCIVKLAGSGHIEIDIFNYEEYLKLKEQLSVVCVQIEPSLDQDYRFIDRLGQGSQAIVDLYKFQRPPLPEKVFGPEDDKQEDKTDSDQELRLRLQPADHRKFAVKKYKMNPDKFETEKILIFNEINFLRELKICENIVQLEAVYTSLNPQTREKTVSLVMRYAQYGSTLKYLQRRQKFTEEEIRTIMAQILLAIDLMHRKGLIHRDIKPDNILIQDRAEMKICISDLGLACRVEDEEECKLKCGTPGYVGPEVLKGAPFSQKSDIFSIGSFFFNMLTCSNLFVGKNGQEMLIANKYQNPYSAVQMKVANVSPECKQLLLQMLQVNADLRPTAEQCIQHNWFSKDREALQNSLFINKNQQLLATLFNQPNIADLSHLNSCADFVHAPNYYELVQCLSSQGSIHSVGKNSGSSGVPDTQKRSNSSSNNNKTGKRNPFVPSFDCSPMKINAAAVEGGFSPQVAEALMNAGFANNNQNIASGASGMVGLSQGSGSYGNRKSSVSQSPAIRFCYNQIITRGREKSIRHFDLMNQNSLMNASLGNQSLQHKNSNQPAEILRKLESDKQSPKRASPSPSNNLNNNEEAQKQQQLVQQQNELLSLQKRYTASNNPNDTLMNQNKQQLQKAMSNKNKQAFINVSALQDPTQQSNNGSKLGQKLMMEARPPQRITTEKIFETKPSGATEQTQQYVSKYSNVEKPAMLVNIINQKQHQVTPAAGYQLQVPQQQLQQYENNGQQQVAAELGTEGQTIVMNIPTRKFQNPHMLTENRALFMKTVPNKNEEEKKQPHQTSHPHSSQVKLGLNKSMTPKDGDQEGIVVIDLDEKKLTHNRISEEDSCVEVDSDECDIPNIDAPLLGSNTIEYNFDEYLGPQQTNVIASLAYKETIEKKLNKMQHIDDVKNTSDKSMQMKNPTKGVPRKFLLE